MQEIVGQLVLKGHERTVVHQTDTKETMESSHALEMERHGDREKKRSRQDVPGLLSADERKAGFRE